MSFFTDAEQAWINAGGPADVAPIMAAIASAESASGTNLLNPKDSNGLPSYGAWQINGANVGSLAGVSTDTNALTNDLATNAKAAVAVYNAQGLAAWGTYTSGAYKSFLAGASSSTATSSASGASGLLSTFSKLPTISKSAQALIVVTLLALMLIVVLSRGRAAEIKGPNIKAVPVPV